jgi:hypothetical protein
MSELEKGFMLISDITGYTAFLHESELEHAQDSLRHLMDLLIEQTILPLRISRLEGDAVISYALQGSFLQGQTFLEIIETIYLRFRQALDLMILNTNCTCKACRNLPNLDLKFFVHYGTFMLEPFGNYTELVGNDVNVIHRLTKNSVTESMDIKAYVLYSQAAVKALDIEEMTALMTPHTESYEHIGEIEMFVQDMHPIWEQRRSELRTVVEPGESIASSKMVYPVPVVTMWDYVTKPEYKAILTKADSAAIENRKNGRIGVGSSYQCAHGDTISPQTIVDWQPFEQYTYKGVGPGPVETLTTISIKPHEDGSEMAITVGRFRGGSWFRRALTVPFMRLFAAYYGPKLMKELQNQIEANQAASAAETGEVTDSSIEAVSPAV